MIGMVFQVSLREPHEYAISDMEPSDLDCTLGSRFAGFGVDVNLFIFLFARNKAGGNQ